MIHSSNNCHRSLAIHRIWHWILFHKLLRLMWVRGLNIPILMNVIQQRQNILKKIGSNDLSLIGTKSRNNSLLNIGSFILSCKAIHWVTLYFDFMKGNLILWLTFSISENHIKPMANSIIGYQNRIAKYVYRKSSDSLCILFCKVS